jgi:hypothetical protein
MNVPAIIEKLEQVKKILNEGTFQIKLLDFKFPKYNLHNIIMFCLINIYF